MKPEPISLALTKDFKLKVTNEHPVHLLCLQKFWEISRQIHEFMTWTQVECPFEKDKKIQNYLLTAPIYSEEGEAQFSTAAHSPPHTIHVTLTSPHLRPLPWKAGLITIPMLHRGSSAHRAEYMRVGCQ